MKKEIFASLEQFLNRIAQPIDTKICTEQESINGSESFCGSASLEEAIDIARNGKELESVALSLNAIAGNGVEINAVHDVAGGAVDIGAFLTNDPMCMIDYIVQENHKMVDIIIDPTENAGASATIFKNKSIVAASVIDRLEQEGYRCRVIIAIRVDASRANLGRYIAEICIKDYQQSLSIGQLVGCCSQSFFRRIGFAWIERMFCEDGRNANDIGYGRSYQIKDGEIDSNMILIPNTNSGGQYDSIRFAQRFVEDIITKFNSK